ncbi:cytochrome c oxidase subunit 3 [Mycobacterium sp. EPa45]|uniref:cytochrome c oxidase subunit 3 n=1 Tax=Mycobacterium sp. EPa45 TaxID=1545728 RepID=UPI000641A0A9|nr:cytochrome c oxidase subunit 3 [Mycobacterium sp. EPa45]AKK25458.1 cytochrome C oxidase subunit III [Mycobacterium sp. EPa45]
MQRPVRLSYEPPQPLHSLPHVPGEPGIWVLLFGDLAIFSLLFVVYLHHRARNPALFSAAQEGLDRTFGFVNTLILLTASLLVALGAKALRDSRIRHMASSFAAAGASVGLAFVVIKAIEYHRILSAGTTPSTNEFYMYYFVLTGLHLAHVIVGLIVLVVISRLVAHPTSSPARISFFEGGACFFHLVDLLWILIFPLIYLVRAE